MKKISFFLTACFIVILAACSNEGSTDYNTNSREIQQKSGDEEGSAKLDSLYNIMITSPKYIALENLTKDFASKTNFKGRMSEIDEEGELLNWIQLNIANTGFTNFTEAENKWKTIISESKIVLEENIAFHLELQKFENPRRYYFNLVDPENSTSSTPCEKACDDDFTATAAELSDSYIASVNAAKKRAKLTSGPGQAEYGEDLGVIRAAYLEACEANTNAHGKCIDGCNGN